MATRDDELRRMLRQRLLNPASTTVDRKGQTVAANSMPMRPLAEGTTAMSGQASATRDARGTDLGRRLKRGFEELTGQRVQYGPQAGVPRVERPGFRALSDARSMLARARERGPETEAFAESMIPEAPRLSETREMVETPSGMRPARTPDVPQRIVPTSREGREPGEIIGFDDERVVMRRAGLGGGTEYRVAGSADGATSMAPVRGARRGSVTSGFQDSYGGEDVSQLSPKEYLDLKVSKALNAADIFRGTRERFAPRAVGPGVDYVARQKALKDYKSELDAILQDSASRKLTARQTSNAISGLKDYYGEALGLDATAMQQQGATQRQAMADSADVEQASARASATSNEPQFVTETDAEGNLVLVNRFTGQSRYPASPAITEEMELYRQAALDGDETAMRLHASRLIGFGIDPSGIQ